MPGKLTAHYYASKTRKFIVFGVNGVTISGPEHNVSGKREAQALAKKHNATPWNF